MPSSDISVPFFDWKQLYLERRDDYLRIFDETASSGGFIMQSAVTEFEKKLEDFLGVKHAIALSDATNAILMGLRAMDIRPGDEVIIPSHGFIAAAQSIHFAGGVPVPSDILAHDGMADAAAIEAKITSKTKAVMPVQVNGRLCDMDAINAVAKKHGILVVEDSAQALGATFNGKGVGKQSLWGCFSFYPSKVLGTFGDAGGLVTNDDELASIVKAYRNHGADENKVIPRDIALWGTNCRMDNIHAAFLSYKMDWYPEVIQRRREIAAHYHSSFEGMSDVIRPPEPSETAPNFDVFQNYEIQTSKRDALREHLSAQKIGTIIQWGGSALHHFKNLGMDAELPVTEHFFDTCMLLPMNHFLTDEQVEHVIASVKNFDW